MPHYSASALSKRFCEPDSRLLKLLFHDRRVRIDVRLIYPHAAGWLVAARQAWPPTAATRQRHIRLALRKPLHADAAMGSSSSNPTCSLRCPLPLVVVRTTK